MTERRRLWLKYRTEETHLGMRHIQTIATGITAAVLLAVGVPHLLAAIWMAMGDPIYTDLGTGKRLGTEEIDTLIKSRETARDITGAARAYTDLGAAYIASGATPESLEKSITSLKIGLEKAPINAFAWQRLATMQALIPDQREEALKAWQAARALAEFEPFLLLDRIRIGVALYREMSLDDREALLKDVRWAYKRNRGGLRAYARQADLLEWIKFLLRDEDATRFMSG